MKANYKKILFTLIIAAIVILSWWGLFDELSDKYTDDSIINAGVVYALARGINAIVSALQTGTFSTEILIFSNSIAIGELLDPINDFIERFSQVIFISLSSLALQKILLLVVSHTIFKILITFSGIFTVATLWFKKIGILSFTQIQPIAWRVFLLLIFVRFALALTVFFNNAVDDIFFDEQIKDKTTDLADLKIEVYSLNPDSIDSKKINEEIAKKEKELINVKNKLKPLQNDWNKVPWRYKIPPFRSKKTKQLIAAIEGYEEKQDSIENRIKTIKDMLNGNISISKLSDISPQSFLEKIGENLKEKAKNLIILLMLFILKTILIPLLFFYGLLKATKMIWRKV